MQIEYCEQRTPEWHLHRRGKPTSSRFDKIVTSAGKPVDSKARHTYALQLAGERFTRITHDYGIGPAAEHGIIYEPKGRGWFTTQTDMKVAQVGTIFPDGHRDWCASPDGMIDGEGQHYRAGLEIKAPQKTGQLAALYGYPKLPTHHKVQVQGQMWVTGCQEWYYVSYTEDGMITESGLEWLPSKIWTVEPDRELHKAFEKELPKFCKQVEEITEKLREAANG